MPLPTVSESRFPTIFQALSGHAPMGWQRRLFEIMRDGEIPAGIDLPTGVGKTSVMAIWLLSRVFLKPGAVLPRRLIYVVDRRVVVDQATEEARTIATALGPETAVLGDVRERLGLRPGQELPISTLRGGLADDRAWTYDPAAPAIIVGTVDMIGSRLLFSGYRMGRWSRSMQAGLLGSDSLIVLDEAHLSPAFEQAACRALVLQARGSEMKAPASHVLPLSATMGEAGGRVFRLEAADKDDPVVRRRTGALDPTKRLTFQAAPAGKDGLVEALAGASAGTDGSARAVLVYCHSREVANRTAVRLRAILGQGRADDVGLVTGVRRGYERDKLVDTKTFRAFTYAGEARVEPGDRRTRFLVCTSAGEVGADLDADAAVMDLVPLERMVQRLGRVNRRGLCEGLAEVSIHYDPSAFAPPASEKQGARAEAARLAATKVALEALPGLAGGGHDGSPARLGEIGSGVRKAALTLPPSIPTIEREHVEAWALTSLKDHPGRPEAAPFLRGMVEEEPQTTVAWRADVELLAMLPDVAVERALAAARLRPAEMLEAPTARMAEVLAQRCRSLRKVWASAAAIPEVGEEDGSADGPQLRFLLFRGGRLAGRGMIGRDRAEITSTGGGRKVALDGDANALREVLDGLALLLPPAIGGLDAAGSPADCGGRAGLHVRDGLLIRSVLSGEGGALKTELIGAPPGWVEHEGEAALGGLDAGLRRRLGLRCAWSAGLPGSDPDEDGPVLEYWTRWDVEGETGAAAQAQTLEDHHTWASEEMEDLVQRLALPDPLGEVLIQAIAVHDSGKDRLGWQDGAGTPRDGRRPYAKSERRGPGVGTYRHEFGSLRDVVGKKTFDGLEEGWRDLALHLIAAHHGRTRPSIPAEDEDEIFTEVLDQEALEAALRYVRLQRRWGPWGLAWLEALFRSVDATVSRRLDQEGAEGADARQVEPA